MKRKCNVIIVSGPIRTGKTTVLWRLFSKRNDVAGFLTPDIDGKRHFINMGNRDTLPFEVKDITPEEAVITVGKFRFLEKTFLYARDLLMKPDSKTCYLFIIDEIGKLELDGKGYEPGISQFLKNSYSSVQYRYIVIVVRDSLVEQVVAKYKLKNATITDIEGLCKMLEV